MQQKETHQLNRISSTPERAHFCLMPEGAIKCNQLSLWTGEDFFFGLCTIKEIEHSNQIQVHSLLLWFGI